MSRLWHRAGCCCVAEVGCEHCAASRTPAGMIVTLHDGNWPELDGRPVALTPTIDDPCTWTAFIEAEAPPWPSLWGYWYRVTITAANLLDVSIRYSDDMGFGDVFLAQGADFSGADCDEIDLAGLPSVVPPFTGTADVEAAG